MHGRCQTVYVGVVVIVVVVVSAVTMVGDNDYNEDGASEDDEDGVLFATAT